MTKKGALFGSALVAATLALAALFPKAHALQLTLAWLLPLCLLLALLPAGVYLKNKFARRIRLSWQLPLAGYAVTFLVAAGFSLSNENIRAEVEIVGFAVWLVFSIIGFIFTFIAFYRSRNETRWRTNAIAGLACNLLLASLTVVAAHVSYEHKTRSGAMSGHASSDFSSTTPIPVWIDTDPACGAGMTADVDDCWALLTAFRSPELAIRGISTVFGNQSADTALQIAREVVPLLAESVPKVYAGSQEEADFDPNPASRALAQALEQEPLTIIAQGPLTNIATLIKNRPDLRNRITRIVFIGGKHPGQLFHPGHQWWFHFGDLNVSEDPRAAEIVLYSGVPLTLIPFELATNLMMTPSDLELLRTGDENAKWLSEISQPWLSFWEERLGRKGFYPFDALAISYLALPEHFDCRNTRARIGFSVFLAPFGMGRDLEVGENLSGPGVTYCFDLDREFKDVFLARLMGEPEECQRDLARSRVD